MDKTACTPSTSSTFHSPFRFGEHDHPIHMVFVSQILHLYFAAAKDYFFNGFWMTFFSQHCIGAIPLDRKENKREAIRLCVSLLTNLSRIWLVMFPEGTRSATGHVREFKRGVSLISLR